MFIPQCFTLETLNENRLFMLLPMHRFGWYCAQVFAALEGSDAVGDVRLLREGLTVCEGVKDMVKFLTEHTPELRKLAPSEELLALAEQVRMLLAAYPAGDPMVEAIKASESYQKAAYFIEGIGTPTVGGLPQ